ENISGEISFDNRNKLIIVDIPEIYFCNLSLQAIYEKDLENQYIYVEVLPSKGNFLDLFSCLYPEEMPTVILEGPYNIEGYFYAEGDTKTLIKDATGTLEIRSNKGYIYRAPILARVFSYISPIDLFRGKVPNLESNLLEYEELDVKTFFENATLNLDTGFLSAVGFRLFGEGKVDLFTKKLNLTFYVSPFKTIDVIIEKIPYLGKWILGKPRMLIYLPLQVTGTYKDYDIVPLHPSSIGKGIFTFIFRIFGIPEEFFKKEEIKELKKQKLLERKERYEKIDKSP
ncbi:MAG: AsmA-like C-terminal domain-containing protein, partial [Thermodesulfobacterium sp.]|nr:AsmA-like C-terminal domain-containing protein [Thermodesulfobacterium sp.]